MSLLATHCLAVLLPVMSTPRHPLSSCSTSSHVLSSPPTLKLFYIQSCPLLATHCLAVLLPVMSTPRHPLSSCSTSSHVHSSPPTVYLFPVMSTPHHPPCTCFQSCPSTCLPLTSTSTHRLPVSSHVHSSPTPCTCFQSCPLFTTHPSCPLLTTQSVLSTSSHVHSSPPIV